MHDVRIQDEFNACDATAGIILTAFGASDPDARKAYDYIDMQARARFAGCAVSWAFTSGAVRAKLAGQGVVTMSPAEAVDAMRRKGCRRIVLQSLHVAPGQEYRALRQTGDTLDACAVGDALLSSAQDMAEMLRVVGQDIIDGAANVVVAHGNARFPDLNRQVLAFAQRLEALHAGVWVCSVEGQPGTANLQAARRMAARTGRVHFIPLMLVAGEHIMQDVMGHEPDAWRMRVGARHTSCARPLGYNDRVLEIFFRHAAEALSRLAAAG
jgi:sirohydrochlorin cobaltochelatase